MPYTNKQTARIRIINSCLTNKKYLSMNDLLEELAKFDIEVSERTVKGDIHRMRYCGQLNYHAPLEYCKLNNGYYYADPQYSTDRIPLSNNDIKALELAATTLDQYRYIPLMSEFTTTIDKIIRVVNRVKSGSHATILDFIEFEKTPVAVGLEFMDTIIEAIQNKVVVEVTYQKFEEATPTQLMVHPYMLKEYRNRWYVIGFSEVRQDIRTYAFDRIKTLTIKLKAPFIPNTFINTNEYLKNCIGINLKDGKAEMVILKFVPSEGMYIKTQKLHQSQVIIQDDKSALIVSLDVVVNFELVGIILSYGSAVKILEPQHLRDKIKEIASKILALYQG